MSALKQCVVLAFLITYANSDNSTVSDSSETCELGIGPWSLALEDWATSAQSHSDTSDRHACGDVVESMKHILCECDALSNKRRDLFWLAYPQPEDYRLLRPSHIANYCKCCVDRDLSEQGRGSGRIMALAPSKGYYVTERIDTPIPQPSPPPNQVTPGVGLKSNGYKKPAHGHIPQNYNEWDGGSASGPGKIVNKPNKDKFRPSYPAPSGPSYQHPTGVDRVDEVPQKQVSETDLYLLSAIEKLVYRADLTEKRLRKLEESLHYLIAGADKRPESCGGGNFTRVGRGCYWWSRDTADWKDASRACRRRSAALLELAQRDDARALISALLSDKQLSGYDYWTGGLNPGLLWIWSNSARPIQGNSTENITVTITGEGRCLALVHEPALRSYMYRGQDCGFKHRYICQMEEDTAKLSNEIQKTARALSANARQARQLLRETPRDGAP